VKWYGDGGTYDELRDGLKVLFDKVNNSLDLDSQIPSTADTHNAFKTEVFRIAVSEVNKHGSHAIFTPNVADTKEDELKAASELRLADRRKFQPIQLDPIDPKKKEQGLVKLVLLPFCHFHYL
jgi:hypothetical protein